ncbi:MAG: transferase, partial [Pyrinomonadaceae bacterium]|nr:transferase [Phycisphaerales bacterium]
MMHIVPQPKPDEAMHSAVAIILARAGSKGVPGKNTAFVGGRPCIEWTIDAAKGSHAISDTIVSTDCARVRAIAKQHGLNIIERPTDLASDAATVDAAAR